MAHRTVSEVAAASGVTVRTLHHYDHIGLLPPSERSEAGYRLYTDDDLTRLHAILTWRALGFPLEEVQRLVDDPDHDALESLQMHRRQLIGKLGELHQRIAEVDAAIERQQTGAPLTEADLVALFDGFDPRAYEAEVEARWGDTEAFQEAQRRTRRYRAADWQAMREEQDALHARFAALARAHTPVHDLAARKAVLDHQQHITRWFYPCEPEIHRGLAEMYREDPRFRATYEALQPGLADWLAEAIEHAYTARPKAL